MIAVMLQVFMALPLFMAKVMPPRGDGAALVIMPEVMDACAGPFQLLSQGPPLVTVEMPVPCEKPIEFADMALLLAQGFGFLAGQIAVMQAFFDALLLAFYALIEFRITVMIAMRQGRIGKREQAG